MSEMIPLGKITKQLDDIGYEVTYAHNDLIFIKHSPFILRFDLENVKTVHFYAHHTFKTAKHKNYYNSVKKTFRSIAIKTIDSGSFDLKESNQENNVDVVFYEQGENNEFAK